MRARATLSIVFAAAAGPRVGFGHLVRCGVLAQALHVRQEVVLRGGPAARRAAARLGWSTHSRTRVLTRVRPDVVVVDDPSDREGRRWVAFAHAAGVPVVAIDDLGLNPQPSADLTVDGSFTRLMHSPPADLQGAQFAMLAPWVARLRARGQVRRQHRVLIALGGGAHVRAIGVTLASRIRYCAPHARIDLAAGFLPAAGRPALPPRCRWIEPRALPAALATTTVAVVAGGLTAYEACALGTPLVTLPVTPAQELTTTILARLGASLDAGPADEDATITRAAANVAYLLATPVRAHEVGACGWRLVDGQGARRVADRIRAIATEGSRRAA